MRGFIERRIDHSEPERLARECVGESLFLVTKGAGKGGQSKREAKYFVYALSSSCGKRWQDSIFICTGINGGRRSLLVVSISA